MPEQSLLTIGCANFIFAKYKKITKNLYCFRSALIIKTPHSRNDLKSHF